MKPALFSCVLVAGLLAAATGPGSAKPISLHPENPHYFLWRGKPSILITSAEHYGAVLNLDFDYEKYLAALAKDGLNLTRAFSGVYFENPGAFKIERNTLAPAAGRYIGPWRKTDASAYDLFAVERRLFRAAERLCDEGGCGGRGGRDDSVLPVLR